MIAVYIIIGIILLSACLWAFCVFPSRRKTDFFEKHKYFAHRGLHDNVSIPENSLAAFAAAAEKGYGIELDVHLTSDGKLIVFHDDDTSRMCGEKLVPEKEKFDKLRSLSLLGTEEKIPSFDEVLALVAGRVPLIVEIKGITSDTSVCALTAQALASYGGEYCVESFNPVYVGWWKKNRPDDVRGQLSCKMPKQKGIANKLKFAALGNMLLNFISRPDFIAYDHNGSGRMAFRLARALGGIPVAWTVRTAGELEKAKKRFVSFIFENEEDTIKNR
ncbi:MAG: glycerophosphodiester phosphodiesterase [Clostridia bacterium]|nr:glycerophosphodiester phosphodiesterase [Clostridia bacterium]